MRAAAVLALALPLSCVAPTARAETQVNAEDCSSAVSGTMIGSRIEIHCLSQEDVKRVVDELVRQGVVKRAEDAGIEISVIASLAARLKPTQKLDFAQAVIEVSRAVDVAIDVAKEGSGDSNDQLVNETLKRIAEKTKANDPAGATREAEEGFARWEKQETERRTTAIATGAALLEAALKTDLLRFDAAAAAGRVEKISSLQHEGNPRIVFDAVRARQDQFYTDGRDKGINLSLQVAIAIARREVALAQTSDQRGAAFTDLGLSFAQLGERERGPENLELAIAAYFGALQEYTRERFPLDWAASQNALGLALWRLGERQNGTEKLEQEVTAYREALKERRRARSLQWAETQTNLAISLALIGERDRGRRAEAGDRSRSCGARGIYPRASTARLREDAAQSRDCASNGRSTGDAGREELEQAVAASRDRLRNGRGEGSAQLGDGAERSRQCAHGARGAENSTALLSGRSRPSVARRRSGRASGFRWTGRRRRPVSALRLRRLARGRAERSLDAAVAVYHAALQSTHVTGSPQWAAAQNNLGNALKALGRRESGTVKLDLAASAYREGSRSSHATGFRPIGR